MEQAITKYYLALNAAVRDPKGSTDALAELIDPQCTCAQVLDLLREEARQRRYLDYQYSVRDVRVVSVGPLGGDATYVVVQSPGAQRGEDGKILKSFPGGTEKLSTRFTRTSTGKWLLTRAVKVK